MNEKMIDVKMTESEYRLFKNLVEDKEKRNQITEECLIRAKDFKTRCIERINEYKYPNDLAIYTHIRYLAGLRCGVRNNARKGLTENEYQNMIRVLDEILPPLFYNQS